MCGPDCTTTTTPRNSAAAIAVIHSTAPTTATSNQLRLFFTNAACPATGFTRVSTDAQALAATTGPTLGLAIHNHGDLAASPSSSTSSLVSDSGAATHALEFVDGEGGMAVAQLRQRLELSVGGEGVIGKMVSVTSSTGMEFGNGIVGWN